MHGGRWLSAVLSGGAVVAAVGLSHTLAVGALSVLPLGAAALSAGIVASFVAATVGTIFCALMSRTPGEICGPLPSISVIYAALCADLVMRGGQGTAVADVVAGLSLAVVIMGLIQMLAGWSRLGEAVKFLPYPVNAGFVTGVGVLVVWSQLGSLIGLDGRLSGYDWSQLIASAKPWALLVGIAAMALVWMTRRFTRRVQPLLVGLIGGTALYHGLAAFVAADALGPTVGAISIESGAAQNIEMFWSRLDVDWVIDTSFQVLPYSAFLAIQGIMNAAVNSVAIADVSGVRSNVNRIVLAQGVTNILCGLLAALPVASSPSQSLIAARMRGIANVVPSASGAVLLLAVLVLGPVLAQVPTVVLAALLITAGVGLIDSWTKRLVARAVRGRNTDRNVMWNLAIVLTVAGSFFFGNVPLALMVGAVMATILLLIELSSSTELAMQEGVSMASRRVWPVDEQGRLQQGRSAIRIFRPRGGLFFATADQLAGKLEMLDDRVRYCVIDCSRLTVLDATGCRIIASSAKKLAGRGMTTVLAGLDLAKERDRRLIELGLDAPSAQDRWFRDLDHALEWIETDLLMKYSPEVAVGMPVALEAAQLTEGLSAAELDVLRPHLLTTRLEAGDTLFRGGEPGSSIYIVGSGLIEIRIDTDQTARASGWRRMAVLGPGCIFGEVAMLTGGQRSADAVCVKPAELFELKQESLDALSTRFPAIHSRILANLNRHLATRLIAATEIARSL
jgi:SulP family sulfate permease